MQAPNVQYDPVSPDYRDQIIDLFEKTPFGKTLGMRIIDLGPGWFDCELDNNPPLQQQHGFGHAGVVATLADVCAGLAAASLAPDPHKTLSVEFKIALLKPAIGERLIARGRVIKPGKRITVAESWIYGATGSTEKLCARGYVTLAVG